MMMLIDNKSGSRKVAAVTLLAGALLLVLALAGCGGDQEATNTSTAEVKTVTVTATTTTAATVAKPVTTATTSTTADCAPADEPPAAVPSIVSYTVDKGNYNVGDLIKFTAQIQGEAASVRVIYGPSGGDISSTHYISVMTVQSTAGGVTTWGTGGFAPEGSSMPGIEGQCFYRVEIVTADNTLIKALDDSHYFQVS